MQIQQLSIPLFADSFIDLIKQPLFIDKTKYIKIFIETEEDAIQLNRPRRWGKTMALNMLSTFFNPHPMDIKEFTDQHTFKYDFKQSKRNWKIFSNLEISKDKQFMETYLGQYPVIHINLTQLNEDNPTLIQQSLKSMISNLYHQYYYLYDRLDKIYKNNQNDNIKSQLDSYISYLYKKNNNLEFGLRFLCQLQYEFFQKKIIVLIDEYDSQLGKFAIEMLTRDVQKQELVTQITDQISLVLKSFIKDNSYVEKILITGILDAIPREQETGLDRLTVLNLACNQNIKLQQMVGMTELELQEFFSIKLLQICAGQDNAIQKQQINKFLSNLENWNSGYELLDNHEYIFVYNPISVWHYFHDVLGFLVENTKSFPIPQSYWSKTGSTHFFFKLTHMPVTEQLIKSIYQLVKEDILKIEPNEWIFPYLLSQQQLSKQNYDQILLGILHQFGYLKISRNQKSYEFSSQEVANDLIKCYIEAISNCLKLNTQNLELPQKLFKFNKEQIIELIQDKIFIYIEKIEQNIDIEFYLKAYFTCLSINTYMDNKIRNINQSQNKIELNKNIKNILFPITQLKQHQRKLLIHKYKFAHSKRLIKQLLERTIWSLYTNCYMSGYTSSQEWYCIVLRAIVFYYDGEKGWKIEIAEFQHLNQVAQILLEQFFQKDGKLLENHDELKQFADAREQFLNQYGCSNFKEFIRFFEFQEQNYQRLLRRFNIQGEDNLIQQLDEMKISEQNQDNLEVIANSQIQELQQLFIYKEEYIKNLQLSKQIQSKKSTKGKPSDIQKKRQEDRKNQRKYQIEKQLENNRKTFRNK